jgi:Asp-tRNA(Asn)/Glu-tRNA(Gln) amidotransferase A subunit family amidase
VIVGEDPDDPMTARSRGRATPSFARSLARDGLKGARLGVLRQAYERGTPDPEILGVFAKALDDLKSAGATIVDGVSVEQVQRAQGVGTCRGFKYDIDDYLATRGRRAPVHSLEEIIASGRFHPSIQSRLTSAQQANPQSPGSDACKADADFRAAFGAAVTRTLDELTLDAFVYPTWSAPPQEIGSVNQQQAGDNSQVYSPTSGFPAINVPMGYTRKGMLPAGMTVLGRAWDEAKLIRLVYAYEQATHHRRRPSEVRSELHVLANQ